MTRALRRASIALATIMTLATLGFFAVLPAYMDGRLNRVASHPPYVVSEAATRLHREIMIADLHSDVLLWPRDLLRRNRRGHTDVPRLIAGNVALQVFSAVTKVPKRLNYERNQGTSDQLTLLLMAQRWPPATWTSLSQRALYEAHKLRAAAARSGGRLVLAESREDLERFLARRAVDRGMTAGVLSIEGLQALDGRLDLVDTLYAAGYRIMGLAHFFDNEVAGSAHGAAQGGLTPLGRQVVQRIESLGILVDLAHASPRTVDDVLAIAKRPVLVTHTGVKGTCPGPRNLSDDQIRRIAATGGVIGIGYWDGAVCEIDPASIARAIRYASRIAGIDHVALGSDFDGATRTYFDASDLVLVTDALLSAGFREDEVRHIMGANVVRLLLAALPRTGHVADGR
jgi:microsomal dipeptidase-like Zn-dependent dipeptidase